MWVTAFAAAQREARVDGADFSERTVRLRFRVNLRGHRTRIRIGNLYGRSTVHIGQAVLWNGDQSALLTFDGGKGVRLAPGEMRFSSDVPFETKPGDEIKFLVYFTEECRGLCCGCGAYPVEYSGRGNETANPGFTASAEPLAPVDAAGGMVLPGSAMLPALMNVDLLCEEGCAVAVFGDSITQMRYWTDPAEARALREHPGEYALLNLGISGARLLLGTGGQNLKLFGQRYGDAGLLRAAWDLYPLSGVRTVLLAMGINDISQPGSGIYGPPLDERCTANDFLEGVQSFAREAKEHGMRTIGCAVTPFGGMPGDCEETQTLRQDCNAGMRAMAEKGVLAGYVDFAGQIEDPECPERLLTECDSGDHLHPGPEGGRRMELSLAKVNLVPD